MKKRMLSVCLALLLIFAALPLTASAAGEVEINETDFPDPVFRSYVSENFDLNGDLLLDSDEIAAVTSLDLSNTQVENLQGIRFFPLTSLNVGACIKLKNLECYGNQLTALNVNGCQWIERLNCNNNQLTALDLYRGLALRNLSSQTSSLEIQKISGCWTANLGKLVGAENLNKVELKERQDWQYDAATGRASYTGEDVLAQLVYCYNGNNLIKKDLDVTVNLIETEEEQQYVVMKQSAEQAYVNGIVAPTTQYASGYAKMDNVSGTMQLPLRYIAEVNGFTVDYDENTGEIKVTSPADETYLLITPNSSTVTKHTADGTLISSSDAPLAFTIENGVTMGPLRFICEALGLKVSYQETSRGVYVVVSKTVQTNESIVAQIEEAYQLGL